MSSTNFQRPQPDSSVLSINSRILWVCALKYPDQQLSWVLRHLLAIPEGLASELALGERNYTVDMVIKLARELGTSFEWLAVGTWPDHTTHIKATERERVFLDEYERLGAVGLSVVGFFLQSEAILLGLPEIMRRSVVASIKHALADSALAEHLEETADILCKRACARFAYDESDFGDFEYIITPFHEASGIDAGGKRRLSDLVSSLNAGQGDVQAQ